jgi:DNA repair exonuclease SbcCD ATPase subunit
MITLKKLTWNNILSYQNPTSIQLDKEPLIQLVGENGSGKTTIPIVLQEILYGKNIKNIKKQDLVNRHSGKKGYSINLTFSKNNNEYVVDLDRKNTIKLQLFKNSKNISSHKSLDTYKQIADILGIQDFKTFVQLVYQSSTGSLEFLTATDTNRKRFLISLLQLEKYLDLHELFKITVRDKINECSETEGKMQIIKGWINKHEKMDLTKKNKLPSPDSTKQENILKDIHEIENQISGIKKTNQKIVNNNQYMVDLNNLNFNPTYNPPEVDENRLKEVTNKEIQALNFITDIENRLKNLKIKDSICPTCKQIIPAKDSISLSKELELKLNEARLIVYEAEEVRENLEKIKNTYRVWQGERQEWERLIMLIDESIPKETLSKSQLELDLNKKQKEYDELKKVNTEIINHNNEVAAHNSKIDVIKEQLKEYKVSLQKLTKLYNMLSEEADLLEVLKRIFSTNGLVSYKIESSVKELEKTINEYLAEFSHFQIFFKLDKDKLNIQVIDEAGEETTIEGLSAGELGRVNIATILAIRKIMASLTSTEINFLFLDEIVGVLDTHGKEKLTEILLDEGLNTFMVSHEYDHPLVPKLHIIKENNISRIEHG